jgi:chaperonin GroEL
MLDDMAVLTGGQAITEDLGLKLENVDLQHFGKAKKVVVDKDNTTIIEGAGKKKDVEARCEQLRRQITETTSTYDREKLQERLAKLTGGVAIIKVGGHTEAEMKERKFRVDDALNASRAAKQEGVVPGGGATYLRCAEAIREAKIKGDEGYGATVLANALEAPIRQIAENAGFDGRLVSEQVKEDKRVNYAFNAMTGEYGDIVKLGIIDPAKVARCAIQNASSIAGLILTTNTLVTEVKEEKAVAGATS